MLLNVPQLAKSKTFRTVLFHSVRSPPLPLSLTHCWQWRGRRFRFRFYTPWKENLTGKNANKTAFARNQCNWRTDWLSEWVNEWNVAMQTMAAPCSPASRWATPLGTGGHAKLALCLSFNSIARQVDNLLGVNSLGGWGWAGSGRPGWLRWFSAYMIFYYFLRFDVIAFEMFACHFCWQ